MTPNTNLAACIAEARQLKAWAMNNHKAIMEFEVVKLSKPLKDGSKFNIQPDGMHRMFRAHTVMYSTANGEG